MTSAARTNTLVVLRLVLPIWALLSVSDSYSQTESDQVQIEQACIEAYVVDSMPVDVREIISLVCRENSGVIAQLTARLARCQRDCTLGQSALKWANQQGFSECLIGWTQTTRFQDVLIVVDPGLSERRMWTQDVPFLLSRFSLPEGLHLCKWGLIGGPSALIDQNGSEVEFPLLADWVEQ